MGLRPGVASVGCTRMLRCWELGLSLGPGARFAWWRPRPWVCLPPASVSPVSALTRWNCSWVLKQVCHLSLSCALDPDTSLASSSYGTILMAHH